MSGCRICSATDVEIAYEGPLRTGRFGDLSATPIQALRCRACLAVWIPNLSGDLATYYQSAAYRTEVDASTGTSEYFRLHDGEQAKHLDQVGIGSLRGRIIADVGCGAGAFLDFVHHVVDRAIAIEPSAVFRSSLEGRGYPVFPYAQDAAAAWSRKVDIAVSFSVLEHVEDPLGFVRDIAALLKPGGRLVLSTPNLDDLLLETMPAKYGSFFYRKAHLWYFSASALANLLRLAGFTSVKISPYQRFGMGNFIGWTRDGRPQGDLRIAGISEVMDACWKAELERSGRSDYLFAEAVS